MYCFIFSFSLILFMLDYNRRQLSAVSVYNVVLAAAACPVAHISLLFIGDLDLIFFTPVGLLSLTYSPYPISLYMYYLILNNSEK